MLGSITPLGERGRGSRWWLTVSAYVAGSVLAGAATGAALGGVGAALPAIPDGVGLAAVAALLVIALAFDLPVGLRLPTVHRQVEEAWRDRFRGWVWGLGFGLQLGVGVATVVTTATVYVTWAAALLVGTPRGGAAIGAAFGLARALPVFAVARVDRPDRLLGVERALRRLARPARTATVAAGAALGLVSAVVAARW
jgi:hypothetical protein